MRKSQKARFTSWYVNKGYTFTYHDKPKWFCPWWVRPALFLFSPALYYAYKLRKIQEEYRDVLYPKYPKFD